MSGQAPLIAPGADTVEAWEVASNGLEMGFVLPDACRALRAMGKGERPVDDLGAPVPGDFGRYTPIAHDPYLRRLAALRHLERAGCFDGHALTEEGCALAAELIAERDAARA